MNESDLTMEEDIELHAEKAQRRVQTFNWENATYGKVYWDNLDFFINFEVEYPSIVYNDALTSNQNVSSEPTVSIYNAIETNFDFSISFSGFDYEDYTFIYEKDLFSYKLIPADDLKPELVNDNVEINIELCSESIDIKPMDSVACTNKDITPIGFDRNLETNHDDKVKQSSNLNPNHDNVILDLSLLPFRINFQDKLGSQVNWVHVLDFARLTEEMVQTLADMMRMVYTEAEGHVLFTSHAWNRLFEIRALLLGGARRRMTWREFILALGLHTAEEMAEVRFETYWLGSASAILDKEDLRYYLTQISSDRDFLGDDHSYTFIRDHVRRLCHMLISYNISGRCQAPEKVTATDLFYLRSMDQETVNVPYLFAQYLFRHAKGRKSEARMSGGHFIGRLAEHFVLVSDEGLIGLFVIARVLLVINLDELVKLNICVRLGDT
uniref:Uncharacterized protein n=1 Tax=Tanacetum cinerariifolium TaxID=118510 RepID=A0A6L2LPW0_TANCI|nr:hypothetical protein [Tanacetum cinerariifolium]